MGINTGQIDLWKQQYGDIYEYVVKDEGKELKGYLHTPSLLVLDACKMASGKSDLKFQEALVSNCWLGGDKELVEKDEYRAGLYKWLGMLIKIVDGELKKV
jgi:hypothetical protein